MPDWKVAVWDEVETILGIVHPARELRVRTAIDSVNRRANKGEGEGGKLFAWEVVHPWTESGVPLVWRTVIDLKKIPENDCKAVVEKLAELFSQLGFVSKTKAICTGTTDGSKRRVAVCHRFTHRSHSAR